MSQADNTQTRKGETMHGLYDYSTGDYIREATAEEHAASVDAAQYDGGAGVISVDGRSCYVM